MPSRTFAVVGAGVGAAVLAAAGITYASTVGAGSSTVASAAAAPSVHRAAVSVHRAAKPAHPAAKPVSPAAEPAQRAAPAAASSGDKGAGGDRSGGRDGGGRGHDQGRGRDQGRGHEDGGRIYFNDRAYSASAEGCITTGGGLGSGSFSVFNDSRRVIEVFRGFNCDNGAPVAVVGPHGETSGVVTRTGHGGVFGFGDDGVVGSFRVICDRDEW
ncbi:hypothetical protein ACWGLF_03325 [Streptomyces puniciscabiei]